MHLRTLLRRLDRQGLVQHGLRQACNLIGRLALQYMSHRLGFERTDTVRTLTECVKQLPQCCGVITGRCVSKEQTALLAPVRRTRGAHAPVPSIPLDQYAAQLALAGHPKHCERHHLPFQVRLDLSAVPCAFPGPHFLFVCRHQRSRNFLTPYTVSLRFTCAPGPCHSAVQ